MNEVATASAVRTRLGDFLDAEERLDKEGRVYILSKSVINVKLKKYKAYNPVVKVPERVKAAQRPRKG